MNSLPSISHRLFAAAVGPAAAAAPEQELAAWPWHTVPKPTVVSVEVVDEAPPSRPQRPRPVRRLRAWPERSSC